MVILADGIGVRIGSARQPIVGRWDPSVVGATRGEGRIGGVMCGHKEVLARQGQCTLVGSTEIGAWTMRCDVAGGGGGKRMSE